MRGNGVINSIFIMQLTKEQLTDAYEQGLSISTKSGTKLKIVANLMDIFAIQYYNSTKIEWFSIEKFNELQCTIEQPKPKYNGRSVKCDTVEQWQWLNLSLKEKELDLHYFAKANCICISDKNHLFVGKVHNEEHFKHEGYEIISFSDYCKEKGITEPKWIQGFEVKDGYNDVVMVSDDKISINTSFPNVEIRILKEVREHEYPFKMQDGSLFEYARYPRKNEFNEIKFSN